MFRELSGELSGFCVEIENYVGHVWKLHNFVRFLGIEQTDVV